MNDGRGIFRRNAVFSLALVFCLIKHSAVCRGQQTEAIDVAMETIGTRLGHVMYRVAANGEFQAGWVQSSSDLGKRQFPFYDSEATRADLELVGPQVDQYDQILKQWHRRWQKTRDRLSSEQELTDQQRRMLVDEFPNMEKEAKKSIEELLVPNQVAFIDNLKLRYLIRRAGIVTVLGSEPLMEVFELEKQDLQQLRQTIHQQRTVLVKLCQAERETAVKKMLEPLTEQQRELVLQRWPYLDDAKSVAIDRLRIQIACFEGFPKLEEIEPPLLRLRRFPGYLMDAAGSFHPEEISTDKREDYLDYETVNVFFEMLKGDLLPSLLKIDELQRNMLEIIENDFRQECGKSARISLEFSGGSKAELEQVKADSKRLLVDASATAMEALKECLTKPQWRKFESSGETVLDQMYGPAYSLVTGQLGSELELSSTVKEAIQKACESALQELEAKTRNIETQWLETVLGGLEKEKRKRVVEALGPQPTKTPVNMSVYLSGT